MHKAILAFALVVLLTSCTDRLSSLGGVSKAPVTKADSKPVPITIVGLNDLHGTIEARDVKIANGKVPARIGGLEMMAGYFDAVRASNPGGTLFVDSGDIYQGSLLSNWFQGRSLVKAYNALQMDASTFGNHEFDFGDRKGKALTDPNDPQGALKVLLGDAKFKVVSTNVRRTKDTPQFPGTVPSALFDRNGVRIGVLGVTTVTTPSQSSPRTLVGLEFKALETAVTEEAKRLRAAGAQLVILLSHAGGKCDMQLAPEKGDEACKSNPVDEITQLLTVMPAGSVDLVMAGHTHFAQAHFIRGVPVVQTTGFGASFSYVRVWIRPDVSATAPSSQRISTIELRKPVYFCHSHFANYDSCNPDETTPADLGKATPASFLGRAIQPRADFSTVLAPYVKEVDLLQKQPLFELARDLSHDRSKESPTANCVADIAHRAAFNGNGPANGVFLSHSGGIRAGLRAGTVTYGDFFRVLPFDESLVVARLSGETLERYAASLSTTAKSIAVLSAPWQISLGKEPVFPRFRSLTMPDGRPVDKAAEYLVVTSEFNTLEGGPGDAIFAEPRKQGAIKLVGDALRDYLVESFKKGRANETLPASCRNAGPLDRTKYVD